MADYLEHKGTQIALLKQCVPANHLRAALDQLHEEADAEFTPIRKAILKQLKTAFMTLPVDSEKLINKEEWNNKFPVHYKSAMRKLPSALTAEERPKELEKIGKEVFNVGHELSINAITSRDTPLIKRLYEETLILKDHGDHIRDFSFVPINNTVSELASTLSRKAMNSQNNDATMSLEQFIHLAEDAVQTSATNNQFDNRMATWLYPKLVEAYEKAQGPSRDITRAIAIAPEPQTGIIARGV